MTERTKFLRKIISWKSFALQNHFRFFFNSSTVKKKKKERKYQSGKISFGTVCFSVSNLQQGAPKVRARPLQKKIMLSEFHDKKKGHLNVFVHRSRTSFLFMAASRAEGQRLRTPVVFKTRFITMCEMPIV